MNTVGKKQGARVLLPVGGQPLGEHRAAWSCIAPLICVCVVLSTARAWAQSWTSPQDVQRLCARSVPLTDALPSLWGTLRDGETGSVSEEQVFEAQHAYARERAGYLVAQHEVVLMGDALGPLTWDPDVGTVMISLGDGLVVAGAGVRLVFPRRDALVFDGTEWFYDRVETLRQLGRLSLTLEFELATLVRPELPICAESADGGVEVAIHLLSARLSDAGSTEPLAEVRTQALLHREALGLALAPNTGSASVPRVRLTSLHVMSEGTGLAESLHRLQLEMESRLSECYLRALAENAGLQGALVVTFRVEADGQVRDAAVVVDALDCAEVSMCVLEVLEAVQVARTDDTSEAELRASLTFSRAQEREGVRTPR